MAHYVDDFSTPRVSISRFSMLFTEGVPKSVSSDITPQLVSRLK